jgi:glycine C-acetyltransferase
MLGSVDITVGTLSKALAGVGGFVATSKELVSYIKHTTRAFVFASALPPSVAAACLAAINVMQSEPEHLASLWRNRTLIYNGLRDIGFNLGGSQTPIIPVIVGDEFLAYAYTKRLHEEGIFVNPVAYPAVKKQESRLRVTVSADLTEQDIGRALSVFQKIAKELGTGPSKIPATCPG